MDVENKNNGLIHMLTSFENIFSDSLCFWKSQPKYRDGVLRSVRRLNKFLLELNKKNNFQRIASQIVTKSMDDCQIWQQIEIYNSRYAENLVKESIVLLSYKPRHLEISLKGLHYPSKRTLNNFKWKDTESKSDTCPYKRRSGKHVHSSMVDDDFFKLNEMEKFSLVEETKEHTGPKTLGIDYFDVDSTDYFDKENLFYKQFFNSNEENMDFSNSLEMMRNSELLSDCNNPIPYSLCQLSDKIEENPLEKVMYHYEASVIGEKLWQMQGEVPGNKRPKNSLLEELLEFDPTTNPAPAVTEKTTECLESLIIYRIKNKIWDDVIRVVRPVLNTVRYEKNNFDNQEKPKESLTKLYENQYAAALEKLTSYCNKSSSEQAIEEHREIKNDLRKLCLKLETFSNFHLTNQPVVPEAKILMQTTAVETEECLPLASSTSMMLKPEEIYGKVNELVGISERSHVEKNQDFRKKRKPRPSTKISSKKGNKQTIPCTKLNMTKLNKHGVHKIASSPKKFFSNFNGTPLVNKPRTSNRS